MHSTHTASLCITSCTSFGSAPRCSAAVNPRSTMCGNSEDNSGDHPCTSLASFRVPPPGLPQLYQPAIPETMISQHEVFNPQPCQRSLRLPVGPPLLSCGAMDGAMLLLLLLRCMPGGRSPAALPGSRVESCTITTRMYGQHYLAGTVHLPASEVDNLRYDMLQLSASHIAPKCIQGMLF